MIASTAKKKRVTILDLRDSPWVDGPGRTILDCAESLRTQGYNFIVGAFSENKQTANAYADEASRRNLPVKKIYERGPFDYRVIGQVIKLIDEVGADIVHTHGFRSNVFGLLAARLRHKAAVTTVHGWIANSFKAKLYVAADKAALRFFDRVITVSERTKEVVVRTRVPPDRISVISNALVLDQYVPDRHANAFRRELGVGPDTLLIANIGRLSPEKGQFEFLRAAGEVVRRYANVKFILIGVGPDREKLERFVVENGLLNVVVFTGFRQDMIHIYNSLDLVVQSSLTEGMPNVVLEALLMEVPVIATDVGGTAEIVEDQRTGVLIRPGSVRELVEKIVGYCQDPAAYQEMARKGRCLVTERYDHRRRIEKLAALYESLLGGRA